MTTAIKVDAHAGWDVEVIQMQLDSEGNDTIANTVIVPKHTEQTFYIHSHMRLSSVKELRGD